MTVVFIYVERSENLQKLNFSTLNHNLLTRLRAALYKIRLCIVESTNVHLFTNLTIFTNCDLLIGLGYGMITMVSFVATFYNVIIAYTLFYLFASFTKELPWKTCDNDWNTPNCWVTKAKHGTMINDTYFGNDTHDLNGTYASDTTTSNPYRNIDNVNDTFSLNDTYDGGTSDNALITNRSSFLHVRPSEEYF